MSLPVIPIAIVAAVTAVGGAFGLRYFLAQKAYEWAAKNGYSLGGEVELGYYSILFFDKKNGRLSVWKPIGKPFELPFTDLLSDQWQTVNNNKAGVWTIMTRNASTPVVNFRTGPSAGPKITAAMLGKVPNYQRIS